MTYLPLAILLAIGLIALTALGEIKSLASPDNLKRLAVTNALLAGIGVLTTIITHITAVHAIRTNAPDESFEAWADDMFGMWYQIALPVFAVLLGITVLSSLTALADAKQRMGIAPKMRVAASCASSGVFLILAPFYGFMTKNDTVPLYSCILWSGVGLALIMRIVCTVEYCGRLRLNVKKK